MISQTMCRKHDQSISSSAQVEVRKVVIVFVDCGLQLDDRPIFTFGYDSHLGTIIVLDSNGYPRVKFKHSSAFVLPHNVRHDGVAGVDFVLFKRWLSPRPCMPWRASLGCESCQRTTFQARRHYS